MSLTRTLIAFAGILLAIAGVGGSDMSGGLPTVSQSVAILSGMAVAAIAIFGEKGQHLDSGARKIRR